MSKHVVGFVSPSRSFVYNQAEMQRSHNAAGSEPDGGRATKWLQFISDVKPPGLRAGAPVILTSGCAMCAVSCGSVETVLMPESWTPCGTVVAMTPSHPSSGGTGHISRGPWVLVNITGRWCGKPTVLVSDPKAT